jgi:hypothetical protein
MGLWREFRENWKEGWVWSFIEWVWRYWGWSDGVEDRWYLKIIKNRLMWLHHIKRLGREWADQVGLMKFHVVVMTGAGIVDVRGAGAALTDAIGGHIVGVYGHRLAWPLGAIRGRCIAARNGSEISGDSPARAAGFDGVDGVSLEEVRSAGVARLQE